MNNHPYEKFFSALSHPTRLSILQLLRKGPRSVLEIVDALKTEQSGVSHNLQCLSRCGFVVVKRSGKQRIYTLNGKVTKQLLKMIDGHIHKYRKGFVECGILKGKKCC